VRRMMVYCLAWTGKQMVETELHCALDAKCSSVPAIWSPAHSRLPDSMPRHPACSFQVSLHGPKQRTRRRDRLVEHALQQNTHATNQRTRHTWPPAAASGNERATQQSREEQTRQKEHSARSARTTNKRQHHRRRRRRRRQQQTQSADADFQRGAMEERPRTEKEQPRATSEPRRTTKGERRTNNEPTTRNAGRTSTHREHTCNHERRRNNSNLWTANDEGTTTNCGRRTVQEQR